jgi:hypothetical protein
MQTSPNSRRAVLKFGVAALTAGAAAAVATRASAQQDKVDQKTVMYQAQPKDGQKCSTCVNFQAPNACKLVAGQISPDGWCGLYAAKPA